MLIPVCPVMLQMGLAPLVQGVERLWFATVSFLFKDVAMCAKLGKNCWYMLPIAKNDFNSVTLHGGPKSQNASVL